jgi:hypothetical protein
MLNSKLSHEVSLAFFTEISPPKPARDTEEIVPTCPNHVLWMGRKHPMDFLGFSTIQKMGGFVRISQRPIQWFSSGFPMAVTIGNLLVTLW